MSARDHDGNMRFTNSRGTSQRLFPIGVLAAVASGCAALSHELLWTRRLVDLLGASSEATARVLGCFFLGLALGSALSTRVLRRVRRPWRAIGLFELGIAVATLPALCLPWWTDWIWPSLGPDRLVGWQGSVTKFAVSLVVVVPPAFLMGMTLPVLAVAALGREGRLGVEGIRLYAFNTAGGVLGLLLTAIVTLPLAGAAGAMAIALAINLCVAFLCFHTDLRRGGSPTQEVGESEPPDAQGSPATKDWMLPAMALSFVSGVGVLALEVLAIHELQNTVHSSLPATTALLTTVILVLAVSAFLVPRITKRFGPPSAILPTVLFVVAEVILLSPIWFVFWTDQSSALPRAETSLAYLIRIVVTSMVTFGPALLLAGLVLPLTFAWCDERGGRAANARWGWLLAANGLGGLLGAEAANELLMPALGMHMGIGVIAAFYATAGLIGWVRADPVKRWGWRTLAALLAGLICFLAILYELSTQPQVDPKIATDVRALTTSRDGVVVVNHNPGSGLSILMNNQYLLGASKGQHVERRQMLLPLLFHEAPRRVVHIGHATGITPSGALDDARVDSLLSVEISQSVATMAAEHFAEFNGDIAENPRAEVIVEDGRTFLASATNEFDVIVADLYRPYGVGEGRLYSVEHFRAARRALRDGGLFCQWLPMFQLSEPHFEVILATFLRVFPEAHLVRGNLVADYPLLGIVGFRDGELDWSALPGRCAALREGGVPDGAVRHAESVRMLVLGQVEQGFAKSERVNTLDNAWIEIEAGRLALTKAYDEVTLVGQRWVDFEERLFRRLGNDSESGPTEWAQSGRSITALQHRQPAAYATPADRDAAESTIERQITELLPASMKADPGADPKAFPAQ